MAEPIDLNQLASDVRYKVHIQKDESEAERKARLDREGAQAWHDRWKSTIGFGILLLALLAVGGIAARVVLDRQAAVNEKQWGASVLTSLLAGAVGYVTGQKTGSASK